jgi:DNA-binding NarL/FixJ family response regulator
MTPIRILLVADDALLRDDLRAVFECEKELRVVVKAGMAAEAAASFPRERPSFDQLTAHELEVLTRIAKGRADKEITAVLSMSLFPGQTHVRAISRKLETEDRTQAALLAVLRGLVTPGVAPKLNRVRPLNPNQPPRNHHVSLTKRGGLFFSPWQEEPRHISFTTDAGGPDNSRPAF